MAYGCASSAKVVTGLLLGFSIGRIPNLFSSLKLLCALFAGASWSLIVLNSKRCRSTCTVSFRTFNWRTESSSKFASCGAAAQHGGHRVDQPDLQPGPLRIHRAVEAAATDRGLKSEDSSQERPKTNPPRKINRQQSANRRNHPETSHTESQTAASNLPPKNSFWEFPIVVCHLSRKSSAYNSQQKCRTRPNGNFAALLVITIQGKGGCS